MTTQALEETERCVDLSCGKDTGVPKKMHVLMRVHYIEGAGQLCKECFDRIFSKPAVPAF